MIFETGKQFFLPFKMEDSMLIYIEQKRTKSVCSFAVFQGSLTPILGLREIPVHQISRLIGIALMDSDISH
jgi:hypothetical protein